jgi:hypothetical protein
MPQEQHKVVRRVHTHTEILCEESSCRDEVHRMALGARGITISRHVPELIALTGLGGGFGGRVSRARRRREKGREGGRI